MTAFAISGGKSFFYSSKLLSMDDSATYFTKGNNFSPKWWLASTGISAGRWSTQWNRMQLSLAWLILSKNYLS